MGKQEIRFEQVVGRGCGIDVHKQVLVATIMGTDLKEDTRGFDCFTEDIESLRDWLKANKVTHVAMESTGVYWKPVFNILEEDFEVILVNARHIKNVPGRKTDKADSKWIAKLLLSGLLQGSFIPPRPTRELRDLTRYRRKVTGQMASEKNRLQKILEDANIKLSSVISNMSGATATKIISAMIDGQEDIGALVKLRHGKLRASKEDLAKALNGHLSQHHKFMLTAIRSSIKDKQALMDKLDTKIEEQLKVNEQSLSSELLQTIPGVGKDAAAGILAEIGNHMGQFPNERHLAPWAGMSPGNNEGAGKKKVAAPHRGTNIQKYCWSNVHGPRHGQRTLI